jgi:PAS domain S-box-containing protein
MPDSPPPSDDSRLPYERAVSTFDSNAAVARQAPGGFAHEAGELHRLLVDSVKDYAIFALDPDGYILSWNSGAARLKGYDADQIIGQHFSVFYPRERVAEGFPMYELREAARVGRFEDEGWRLRKDGSRFWANVVITALRKSDGTLAGYAKVTRDLTERRAAEQRMLEDARRVAAQDAARQAAEASRERTERLQRFTAALSRARTIPEISRIVMQNGVATAADAGALGLIDESGEFVRLVGDSGFSELPEWLRRASIDDEVPMSTAVRTGKPVVYRTRSERDASFPKMASVLAPYESTVVLPLVSRDRNIGALAMHCEPSHPLTEVVLDFMSAIAQQTAFAVERAVLFEAEQRARERADEANRAKTEFLAAMSHELRTPLNAIGGYADLIDLGVRGPVTPDQHEDLQRIKRSQQHLLGIINDILNFSRVEAGQISYEYQAVQLKEVLEAVSQMIEPQASARGLRFTVTPCPDHAVAWADQAKVQQILLNLVSNAVKFTLEGSVSLTCDSDGSHQVRITVRDTGVGIPEDELNRIFEPFVQVGRSLTNSREGTGLGLAISRDLARAMNGEITVESRVGVGSAFTLVLPKGPDRSTTSGTAA